MLITGYKLKESLKLKKLKLKAASLILKDSLYVYESDNKKNPFDLIKDVMALEKDIALIQTAQKYYNLNLTVTIEGLGDISLELSIKLLGSYGRKSKLFRDFAGDTSSKRSYYNEKGPKSRSKETEYQKPSLTKTEAMDASIEAELMASRIKTAISMANSKSLKVSLINKENL